MAIAHAKDAEVVPHNVGRSGVLAHGRWDRIDRGFRFRIPGWGDVPWKRLITELQLRVFGIPEVALIDMQGDVMENKHLAPTYLVEPDPAQIGAGRDAQLEKAVEVLMAKLPKR